VNIAPSDPQAKYMVPVVQSTFRILSELSRAGALNLNEVMRCTGVPKSTVFRILTTLLKLGYVVRDNRRRAYYLSRGLRDLFNDAAACEPLRRAAVPHMLKLRDAIGETVNLGKLDLDKIVYLEVVPSEYALRLSERPGAVIHAHASALGKAVLAFSPPELVQSLICDRDLPALTPNTITEPARLLKELEVVRSRGYAIDLEETALQASCIGAPILDARGMAIAALSISGPSSRFDPRWDRRAIRVLLDSTSQISRLAAEETDTRKAAEVLVEKAKPKIRRQKK